MSEMKTIDFKGKPYVEVKERVKYLREHFKDYKIVTELIKLENDLCIFKAMILNEKNEIVSIGHAYEKEGSSFINKTSYIENAESSAVGRALGFFGIGIDISIASIDEIQNAVLNQDNEVTIQEKNEILREAFKLKDYLDEKQKSYFKKLSTSKEVYTKKQYELDQQLLYTIKEVNNLQNLI
jgi:hypothetical protein